VTEPDRDALAWALIRRFGDYGQPMEEEEIAPHMSTYPWWQREADQVIALYLAALARPTR